MTPEFPAAKILAAKFAVLLAAVAVIAGGFGTAEAETAVAKRKMRADDNVAYTSRGPNVSYQSGSRTRVYISKRSWLDAGVEVLPGDRKFNDYAFPPGPSFGVLNNNRPTERQPLNPSSDLGGGPTKFPLY
jgi:hypothetical protein